ncbi:MAG: cytochrome c [Cyanobacteria bacterium SZAS LIN-3]|nr:cytochrome c [Cyanobacteria bacterium SZAS LIN-3]
MKNWKLPAILVVAMAVQWAAGQDVSLAKSKSGEELFKLNHCASCHSVAGQGGCLAPPLDGISKHRGKEFILVRITDENWAKKEFARIYPHEELLQEHPRLKSAQAKEIAAYLMTVPEAKTAYSVKGHKPVPGAGSQHPGAAKTSGAEEKQQIAAGKILVNDRGCLACHSIGVAGGHFAPNLDGIRDRHDRTYVAAQIKAAEMMTHNYPDEYQGRGNVMPPSNLTDNQIQSVVSFLMSLPKQ